MVQKSVPLSLRISDKDAEFLARFEAEGATTPSEKVRFLLAEARDRYGAERPEDTGVVARRLLSRGRKRWRHAEDETDLTSDLVLKLYDRAPDLFGLLMAGPDDDQHLSRFEKALAVEVARILEDVLSQHLMRSARYYNAGLLDGELAPSLRTLQYLRDEKEGKDDA